MAATGSTNRQPLPHEIPVPHSSQRNTAEASKMSSQRLITHSLTGYYSVIIRFKKNFIAVHSMEVLWNGCYPKIPIKFP